MADYKNTLNLPNTAFPMRGNLAVREPKMLEDWEKRCLYKQIRNARAGCNSFILHDGPPYANGNIHIGHAINKVLKDIIVKAKTLSGFDSPYIPGWDCHGLPIEVKVESLVGKPGKQISAAAFREECRKYAKSQVEGQRKDFKRLGVLGDWDHPYLTMNFKTEADTLRALGKVIANGHFVRGLKPVYWCMDCQSALAEAEVEYADVTSDSIYVRFKAVDEAEIAALFDGDRQGEGPLSCVIWTTTPWTLPANRAICVNKQFKYALVQVRSEFGAERVVLAADLVDQVIKETGLELVEILGYTEGTQLELKRFKHPFLDYDVPVILGAHVTLEAGTGCVHTAGGHGLDDYNVSVKYGLEIYNPVDAYGCFKEDVPYFAGLNVLKANPEVIKLLKEKQALVKSLKITHSYPHCWRHKTPVIFRATAQWFISMDGNGLRSRALEEIKGVRWIPAWGQNRIEAMVKQRTDWCISRQRTWGMPCAVLINNETGEIHPRTPELIEEIAKRVEEKGIQAWWDLDLAELVGPEEASRYHKDPNTLDVWFDSGSTHYSVVDQREEFHGKSADLYLEGSDQHRGWFMSSLMLSIAMKDKAPYREVLTHGFTVDGQGRKMSKSLGNVIAPQEVIDNLGADVLRLWVASNDYTGDMTVSHEILKRSSDAYRRVRNTVRFLLANMNGFDPKRDLLPLSELVELDKWAVSLTAKTQAEILKYYDDYDFHMVVQTLMRFCSIELGSFYLDIIKDRQYTAKQDSKARRSCQSALYIIAECLVRWMAPILSFTAQEAWEAMPGERGEFVFTATWYDKLEQLKTDSVFNDEYWQKILLFRDEANKAIEQARNSGVIGGSLEAELTVYCDEQWFADLSKLENELRFVLITSRADLSTEAAPADAIKSESLPMSFVVRKSSAPKCERCWHYEADVNCDPNYPGLCRRCVENVAGAGEQRKYA
ncbi:MAG: isoleucine--tRNA ligase [Succinivibrio sp.]|nr:isoleucine--tRNA ligase [Succinivibrio sp.]